MNLYVRNALAILAGLLIGSSLNGLIIRLHQSGVPFPLPEGVTLTTAEGWKAALPLLKPQHFLMPLLAHALGTLAGSVVAAMFCATRPLLMAMIVGILFLAFGIIACFLIPAPGWFMVTDLAVAYMPMAWLGYKLGSKKIA